MLEIKHTEPSRLAGFCREQGLPLPQDCLAYGAFCGGTVGCCLFRLEGELLTIEVVGVREDFGLELCDGLIRAVYNYGLLHGAVRADFSPAVSPALWDSLAAFGYTHKTDNDIDKFLTNCKKCVG